MCVIFKKWVMVTLILAGGGLFIVSGANAEWSKAGGSLNMNTSEHATRPTIAFSSLVGAHVSWEEAGKIYVKRYNGVTWAQVGSASLNVNSTYTAGNPVIASSGTKTIVAWQEEDSTAVKQIYVKHFNGTGWELLGSSLNINSTDAATNPWLALNSASVPYVAWSESGNINVKHFNESAWEQDGTALNSAYAAFPKITIENKPCVSWSEPNAIYVKSFNNISWEPLNGNLNINAGEASGNGGLAIAGGIPHAPWFEFNGGLYRIFVKKYNGSLWNSVGGSLNVNTNNNAYNPKIAINNMTPYVTWYESNGSVNQIYVKYFDASWMQLGESLNVNSDANAYTPQIAMSDNGLYVVWHENNGTANQIYVKHWEFPAPTVTPVHTSTLLPTSTPDINSIVEADAVQAYPIPAADKVNFAFRSSDSSGEVKLRIFNTHYRLVTELTGQAPGGEGVITWDVSGIAPGIYLYQVRIGDKKLSMKKLVIAR